MGQGTIFSPVTALGQGLEGVPQLSGLFVRQPGEGQLVQLAGEGGGDQLFYRLVQGVPPLEDVIELVIEDLILAMTFTPWQQPWNLASAASRSSDDR